MTESRLWFVTPDSVNPQAILFILPSMFGELILLLPLHHKNYESLESCLVWLENWVVEQRNAGLHLNSPTNFHNFPKRYAYPRYRND